MKTATFDPPGPGVWQLDLSHVSHPLTRFLRDRYCHAYEEGQALAMARYGMPLRTIAARSVNGFLFIQPIPLMGPPGGAPPPRLILKLLSALVPTLRRCAQTADAAMANRQWRSDARRWTDEVWPALQDRFETLQRVDLQGLDDAHLQAHVEATMDAFHDSMVAHFDTNPATMIPTGRLLRLVEEHTEVSPTELLAAVGGRSRVVERDTAALLALQEAIAEVGEEVLEGDPAAVLRTLRQRDGALGEAARAWLERVECRQVWAGDVYLPTARELPQLLVEQLRVPPFQHEASRTDTVAADVRSRLPESARQAFDEALEEARYTAFLRDERCAVNDAWAGGLVRLALLEVGRRLVERGLLGVAEPAIHLTPDELEGLLRRGEGPSGEEAAAHAADQTRTTEEAPAFLGGDPPPPPPADALPGALGEMTADVFRYVDLMEGDLGSYDDEVLRGTPASPGEYIGVARLVSGPADFQRVRPGDVLVARTTMPSYNGALAVAGAVVTDRGGALSHAAIVSRELGIPAVVATINGTKVIADGALLRVDGSTGRVEVLH
jgi:phosphohistidine swiveling domain-containing protein